MDRSEYQYDSDIALPASDALYSRDATSFLTTVYSWMFLGLGLTSMVAWVVSGSESVHRMLFGSPAVFYGFLIAEILLVVVLSAAINRISAGLATFLFLLYAVINGITLSLVFLIYTSASITMAFVSATCLFGTMSLYGYITKRDLTSWGSLLLVGLIAVIVCSVINMFLGSSGFGFLISIVGVVIFLGLTAYDTQKILKLGGHSARLDPGSFRKAAILGALALYLDFVNLFLYMLRLFGKRR